MRADWIALVTVIPLFAGIATTVVRGRVALQRLIGVVCLLSMLGVVVFGAVRLGGGSGVLVSQMGAWEAPYGIALVMDGVSSALLLVSALVSLAAYIASFGVLDARLERGWFHPLFHLLVLGVNFSFLTGDLFNLFVAFEIMLMASYGLMCLGGSRRQLSQAFKYVILNLVGSTVFVLTAGMVYGLVGTLNYADLARIAAESGGVGGMPAGFQLLSVCLLFVFCLKAAVFPLWFWLPDTYHTMPAPIGALFAALLSKVGVYAILRLFPSVFGSPDVDGLGVVSVLLASVAGLTMIVAIVAACAAFDVRRLLAMILISHVGYLVFGISMMRGDGFAGTLHYMAQEMLVMGGLFIAVGVIEKRTGTVDLRELSGVHRVFPVVGGLFFVLSMSLVGIPPLSGFYGKTALIREGFESGSFLLTGATVVTAGLTLVAVGRLWARLFWGEPRGTGIRAPEGAELGRGPVPWPACVGVVVLTIASLGVGLAAEATWGWSRDATAELTQPTRYMRAVLGPVDPDAGGTDREGAMAAVGVIEEGVR